jgi:hypothetical protein
MSFCDVDVISVAFYSNITFENSNNLLKTRFRLSKVTFPKTNFESDGGTWWTLYAEEPMTRTHKQFSIRFLDIQKQSNTWDFSVGVAALPEYRESITGSDKVVGWRGNEWAYVGTPGLAISGGCRNECRTSYGPTLKPGDTITIMLDTFNAEIEYRVNGKFLGVAHRNVPLDVPLYPAISC